MHGRRTLGLVAGIGILVAAWASIAWVLGISRKTLLYPLKRYGGGP